MKLNSSQNIREKSAPKRRAFTLIELLVAGALTLLLGVMLLSVAQGVISGYSRTQGSIVRQGDLSFVLDQIVLDLEGIVVPNAPGAEGLRITFTNLPGTTNQVPWLTLLSTAVDADNSQPVAVGGATRAISYRLAKQRAIEGDTNFPESYGIFRSIASSAHTFRHALSQTNLQSGYWNNPPPQPAPTPRPPLAPGNLLSENVVNFSVLFQYRDNSGNTRWTLPTDTISIRRDGTFINNNPVPGGFLRAQVSVTALSPEGFKRLQDGVVTFEQAVELFSATTVRQTSFF